MVTTRPGGIYEGVKMPLVPVRDIQGKTHLRILADSVVKLAAPFATVDCRIVRW